MKIYYFIFAYMHNWHIPTSHAMKSALPPLSREKGLHQLHKQPLWHKKVYNKNIEYFTNTAQFLTGGTKQRNPMHILKSVMTNWTRNCDIWLKTNSNSI